MSLHFWQSAMLSVFLWLLHQWIRNSCLSVAILWSHIWQTSPKLLWLNCMTPKNVKLFCTKIAKKRFKGKPLSYFDMKPSLVNQVSTLSNMLGRQHRVKSKIKLITVHHWLKKKKKTWFTLSTLLCGEKNTLWAVQKHTVSPVVHTARSLHWLHFQGSCQAS